MKLRFAIKRFFSSNNKLLLLVLIAVTIAIISISYALFTTTLESKGSLNIITGNLYSKLISNELDVDNELVLAPNEMKVINIDMKNVNSIDAKFNLYYSMSKANASVEMKYLNSSEIVSSSGIIIEANSIKKVKIRIINNDSENIVITFGSNVGLTNDSLTYPNGQTITNFDKLPLCKRAEVFHKEKCSQSSGYCADDGYALNADITYGNLTTTNGVLTVGDAFDCDVNGDGIFNQENERFYYISSLTNGVTVNDGVAVLVFYNNVKNGLSSIEGGGYALSADTGSSDRNQNFHGPVTAIKDLPTLEGENAWSNTKLTNTERQITNEEGTSISEEEVLPGGDDNHPSFSYSGHSARLITFQEVKNGCYDGNNEIDTAGGLSTKCKFLFENTKYSKSSNTTFGGWLETPDSSDITMAWHVASDFSGIGEDTVSRTSFRGIRPVIEVLTQDIEK